MTILLVKATVAMLLALAAVVALRHSRASVRHLVLASLFAFLLLLPVADRYAPRVVIPVQETAMVRDVIANVVEAPAPRAARAKDARDPAGGSAVFPIALRVYLSGAAVLVTWLAIGVLRLRRLSAGGEVWLEGTATMNAIALGANIRRSALVILSGSVDVPLTFGFRRSTIVLPLAAREWSTGELERALRHELEHVRREDWALQLLARLAVALYWPHPLAWAAWRRFCVEAERACDDAVVTSSEPEAYAGQLVSLARDLKRLTTVPALGMAGRSRLSLRVRAILDPLQARGPHGRPATVAALAVVVALLVSVAPAQLVFAAIAETWNGGETLYNAASIGDTDTVTRMLDAGADVNSVIRGDGSPLIAAVRSGDLPMLELLLNRGADVNLAVRGDGNALIAAAMAGNLEVTELLLDRGARIDEVVPGDENALITAARMGRVGVARLLIDRGADVNASVAVLAGSDDAPTVRTPLRMARRGGHIEIERMLLQAGARE
jgi:beta-lactamase regulating signal transducer with metallopeptidase domain